MVASGGACATEQGGIPGSRSYIDLPGSGQLPEAPYLWERRARGKHIVVIGTSHFRDPTSPMYSRMEKIFDRIEPQVLLHESTAPPELKSMSRTQAIKVGADLGFAVNLAHARGAVVRSGDAPVRAEIESLLKRYQAQEVLVFLVTQRLIGSARKPDLPAAEAEYPSFFRDYLVANGLPSLAGQETWRGFLRQYEAVVGRPLDLDSWDPDLTSAIRRSGRLNEMSRYTNATRDRYLLAAIEHALADHDRVVVVFGMWHVLALEPVLENRILRRNSALPGH